MKTLIQRVALFATATISLSAGVAVASERSVDKGGIPQPCLWTSEIAVGLRTFDNDKTPAVVSPDGKKFFVIVHRSDLALDKKLMELWLFSCDAVLRAVERGEPCMPEIVVERRSGQHITPPISAAHWQDSDSIAFIGVNDAGACEICRYSVEDRKLVSRLEIPESTNAIGLYYKDGIYACQFFVPDDAKQVAAYPLRMVEDEDLMTPLSNFQVGQRQKAILTREQGSPLVLASAGYKDAFSEIHVLPNSGKVILVRSVSAGNFRADINNSGPTRLRYVFLDLDRGVERPLGDFAVSSSAANSKALASHSKKTKSLFSYADGANVILTKGEVSESDKTNIPPKTPVLVGLNIVTGERTVLEPLQSDTSQGSRFVSGIAWRKLGKAIAVYHTTNGEKTDATIWEPGEHGWISHSAEPDVAFETEASPEVAHLPSGWEVTVKQSANDAPILEARIAGRSSKLGNDDPVLRGVHIARQVPYQWKCGNKDFVGGLMLPESSTRPVPLVIQVLNYDPEQFLPEGPMSFTYAAQELVQNGIAILNVGLAKDEPYPASNLTEGSEFSKRMDAAIEKLVKDGYVDPTHIGIIGFSRGGYETLYMVTHPGSFALAAALVDDAFWGDYPYYLGKGAILDSKILNESSAAGASFWQKTAEWMAQEPTFNVNRVRTPVLFSRRGNYIRPADAQMIGAFQINSKPVEFVTYPGPFHPLMLPQQRLASINLSVDWMTFWLKGQTPADAKRANRWAILRKQQEEVLQTPPPPKGKWVFQPDPVQPEWHPPTGEAKPEEKAEQKKPEPVAAGKN